jgi:hypothetical protein
MPIFFFIIFSAIILLPNQLEPSIYGNIFLVIGLEKIFETYRNDKKWLNYFNASMIISIGSLFDARLIYFFVIIFISLATLRPFRRREWLISLFGIILPYIYLLTYYFVFENTLSQRINDFSKVLINTDNVIISYNEFVLFIYIIILIIFSSIYSIYQIQHKKVSVRKYFQIFLWLFIISLSIYIFSNFSFTGILIYAIFPVSYLLSNYFNSFRNLFWYELFFSVLFALLIFYELHLFNIMKI